MDPFRTIVSCTESLEKITYDSPVLMLGSCFAESIGNKLLQYKFIVTLNPFGIVYHPAPLAQNMARIITGQLYAEDELQQHNELWFSFDHHGRFSHSDNAVCLQQINSELQHAHQQLSSIKWLFITFGSAWAYRLKTNGHIVANCHKYPASAFERIRYDVDEIYQIWVDVISKLRSVNPDINVVFTVSPIRHLRDGTHENQLSKATLLLAVDKLNKDLANTGYFPAYEIMLDDLRDYRFYQEDMTHPSPMALNYIWQRFCESCISNDTVNMMQSIDDIVKAAGHRPIHHTSAYRIFITRYLEKIEQLQQQLPQIDFSAERNIFRQLL